MLKRQKIVSLLAAASLSLTALAGCGGGGGDTSSAGAPQGSSSAPAAQPSAAAGDAADTDGGLFPYTQDPVTLKIFAVKSATVSPYDQLESFQQYEQMTNVKVEWENPPTDNAAERFNLILASGDLPDMFWNITVSQYNQLLTMNVLTPLDDIIASSAPSFKKLMEDYPDDVKYYRDAGSGKIYYFPMVDELTANSPLCVRKDWLEKLGQEAPVTVEDWEKYWKAVKETDLNGNGKNDEIPFTGNDINVVRSLACAWGVVDGMYSGAGKIGNGFYVDAGGDGKVHYGLIEDKYKGFVEWISRMYQAGYIDKEIASSDAQAFQGKVAEDVVASFRGTLNGNLNTFNTAVAANVPGMVYMGADPIKGPGAQIHPGVQPLIRSDVAGAVISATSKNPEICAKYVDYFYDRGEGTYFAGWGLKDKTYTIGADGKAAFTDFTLQNPDGLSPLQVIGKYCFQNQGPAYSFKDINLAMWHPETVAAYERIDPFYEQSLAYRVPTLPFSAEDDSAIRQMMSDITTYTDEMIIKFMLGVEPLDGWDAYVQKVQGMNIDDVLARYNKTYEAWK